MTLKEIAFKLLDKYTDAEESVIWEYSGHIDEDLDALKAERDKWQKMIEESK